MDKKVSLPSLIGPKAIITVWAEEKEPLGDGHYEFSFGNGNSGSEHAYGGYCMSAPGRIIRGSLMATESRNILSEEKILKKKGIKGWLKPVDNLESSHFVLVENKRCAYNSLLVRTEHYKTLLERGETYPPDIVHFLVNSYKRNVLNVNNSLFTHKVMNIFKV